MSVCVFCRSNCAPPLTPPIPSSITSHPHIFAGHEPAVLVWDLTTGNIVAELKGHKFGVSALSFSPHSSILVSVGYKHDRRLYVWNYIAGKAVAAARINQKVYSVKFTSDSKQFITTGASHVKFWSLDATSVKGRKEKDGADGADGAAAPPQDLEESTLSANLPTKAKPSLRDLPELKGIPASILDSHKDSTFIDCDIDNDESSNSLLAVTSSGNLCR